MNSVISRVWEGWKRVAYRVGEKQVVLIYTILYFGLVGPIALLRRPFSDPFQYRKRRSQTFWVPRPRTQATLDQARRQ